MMRLLLCTATVFALTAQANAQSWGPLGGSMLFGGSRGDEPSWSIGRKNTTSPYNTRGSKWITPSVVKKPKRGPGGSVP
jgi:hypothetical protein